MSVSLYASVAAMVMALTKKNQTNRDNWQPNGHMHQAYASIIVFNHIMIT